MEQRSIAGLLSLYNLMERGLTHCVWSQFSGSL